MAQELAKAKIIPREGNYANQEIPVLFNPTEYSLELSNRYQKSSPPGLSSPIIQFVNGEADTLSMDLYFDTHTDGADRPVNEVTDKIASLMRIDSKTHAPPRVRFHWGPIDFVAVIERISQKFTMFRADGMPVRATLNVSFTQYKTLAEELNDPARESSDKTKRRVMSADDSVWLLAQREYGDIRLWRHIAVASGLDDPRSIEPGDVLIVPQLDDSARREVAP
jgi:nucleoid-associated protein YgaU